MRLTIPPTWRRSKNPRTTRTRNWTEATLILTSDIVLSSTLSSKPHGPQIGIQFSSQCSPTGHFRPELRSLQAGLKIYSPAMTELSLTERRDCETRCRPPLERQALSLRRTKESASLYRQS